MNTKEESSKGPWTQRWIVVDVDNVGEDIFGVRDNSGFTKEIFVGGNELWLLVLHIMDLWGPSRVFLGIVGGRVSFIVVFVCSMSLKARS